MENSKSQISLKSIFTIASLVILVGGLGGGLTWIKADIKTNTFGITQNREAIKDNMTGIERNEDAIHQIDKQNAELGRDIEAINKRLDEMNKKLDIVLEKLGR